MSLHDWDAVRDASRRFWRSSPSGSESGSGFSGSVDSGHKDESALGVGDEVYGTCDGAFGEYARIETELLASRPSNLSFEQAAVTPISGVAAVRVMRSRFVSQKIGMPPCSENAGDLNALTGLVEPTQVSDAIDRTFPRNDAATPIDDMREGHAYKGAITL